MSTPSWKARSPKTIRSGTTWTPWSHAEGRPPGGGRRHVDAGGAEQLEAEPRVGDHPEHVNVGLVGDHPPQPPVVGAAAGDDQDVVLRPAQLEEGAHQRGDALLGVEA